MTKPMYIAAITTEDDTYIIINRDPFKLLTAAHQWVLEYVSDALVENPDEYIDALNKVVKVHEKWCRIQVKDPTELWGSTWDCLCEIRVVLGKQEVE